MDQIILSDSEVHSIQSLISNIVSQSSSIEEPNFIQDANIYAHELPKRIRKFLNTFRLTEPPSGICIISGYPINDCKIGETPSHWNWKFEVSKTLEETIFLILLGSLLGDVFGWITQQDGRIVHNVVPIKEHENEQLGSGSKQPLSWHIEDAFHPYRGDYIGLMCLRNPDRVPTTFVSIDMVDLLRLEPKQIKILFESRFLICPDESHLKKNRSDLQKQPQELDTLLDSSYSKIDQMNNSPGKLPVFFGSPTSPYLRIDPYFMPSLDDEEAQLALDTLVREIDSKIMELVLQPGDYCFINNYKSVHGRKAFQARLDGSDRWLKRVNITRDIRKSRDSRTSCMSRIIF